jgi:hypothetical protein
MLSVGVAVPPRPVDGVGDARLLRVDEQQPAVTRKCGAGELLEAAVEGDAVLGKGEGLVLVIEMDDVLVAVAVLAQERAAATVRSQGGDAVVSS